MITIYNKDNVNGFDPFFREITTFPRWLIGARERHGCVRTWGKQRSMGLFLLATMGIIAPAPVCFLTGPNSALSSVRCRNQEAGSKQEKKNNNNNTHTHTHTHTHTQARFLPACLPACLASCPTLQRPNYFLLGFAERWVNFRERATSISAVCPACRLGPRYYRSVVFKKISGRCRHSSRCPPRLRATRATSRHPCARPCR